MRSLIALLGSVVLTVSSCKTVVVYKDPLEKLSKGTTDTRTAIQTLAGEVNVLTARNQVWDAALKGSRYDEKLLNPLVPPQYIEARVKGLLMIERFAAQMLRVVESDAGALASKQVVDFAKDVGTFAGTINSTSPAKNYAAPLGGLAKVVIDLYDGSRREDILERGIHDGIPAARQVLLVLESDFKPSSPVNLDKMKNEELKSLRVHQIAAYDGILHSEQALTETDKASPARVKARFDALHDIIETQRLIDQASSDQVYQTIISLDESLDALVAASKGGVDEEELKALTNQLTTFSDNAAALLEAVTALKTATSADKSK